MKILHVITRGEIGGAQVVVMNLVKNMPQGFTAVVAAGEEGFLEQECERNGVSFRLVPHLIRNINPFSDVIALFHLVSLIREEKFDIVHCHTSKAGVLARVAAWITGTPTVFTAHTWSFDEGVSKIRRVAAVPIERFAALIGGPIIAVSEANRTKALRNRITSPDKIVRIWLGIPDSGWHATPAGHDPVTMIMSARFASQKDHALLLSALTKTTGNWKVKLLGDGPLLAEVKESVERLGLENRVSCLGNRTDVAELLAESDIFVLSTKWEGLPVSILEAMRAGLPIVATDVGGVAEMVKDGEQGFLTRRGDAEQLRDRIQCLVDSPTLRAKMGASARAKFAADFQMETCIRKHVALYRRCLAKAHKEAALETEPAA